MWDASIQDGQEPGLIPLQYKSYNPSSATHP
jgi:hypothetical protein